MSCFNLVTGDISPGEKITFKGRKRFKLVADLHELSQCFFRVFKYGCIITGKSRASIRRKYIIAKQPKRDQPGASFQSSRKINRMFITRLIYIQ